MVKFFVQKLNTRFPPQIIENFILIMHYEEKCIIIIIITLKEHLMASLQVRELPENIYSLLKQRAEAEHRSIGQEAIVLLAKGLDTSIAPKERRTRLLQKIEEEAELNSETLAKLDPVELIREDRRR